MNATRPAEGLARPQEPFQFRSIQAVTADDTAIQEQHRDIEAVTALQHGVAVDIDDVDRREGGRASQRVQLAQHLIAQLTVVAMDDRETWRGIQ